MIAAGEPLLIIQAVAYGSISWPVSLIPLKDFANVGHYFIERVGPPLFGLSPIHGDAPFR